MKNSLNLQGRSLRNPQTTKNNSHEIVHKLATGLKVVCFFAAAGGILNTYIYLNQKIGDTERNIRHIKAETLEVEREIEQRKLEFAELTRREYIQQRIAEYKLNLRPALYAQTRRLVVRDANIRPAGSDVRIGKR